MRKGRRCAREEEARPQTTTDGVRPMICCFRLGWWGFAKRDELITCSVDLTFDCLNLRVKAWSKPSTKSWSLGQ